MDYGKAAYLKVSDLARRFNSMLVEKAQKAEKALRLIKNAHVWRAPLEMRFEFCSLEESDVEVELSLTVNGHYNDATTFHLYVNRMFFGSFPMTVSTSMNSTMAAKFLLPAFAGECIVSISPVSTNGSMIYNVVDGYMTVSGKKIVKWRKKPVMIGFGDYNGAACISNGEFYGFHNSNNNLSFCNKPPEQNITQASIINRVFTDYKMLYVADGVFRDVWMKPTFSTGESVGNIYSEFRTLLPDVRCYARHADDYYCVCGDNCIYVGTYNVNTGLTNIRKLNVIRADRIKKLAFQEYTTQPLHFVLEYESGCAQYMLPTATSLDATLVREIPDTNIRPTIHYLNDTQTLITADGTMAYSRKIGASKMEERKTYGLCDDILENFMSHYLWRDFTFYPVSLSSAK